MKRRGGEARVTPPLSSNSFHSLPSFKRHIEGTVRMFSAHHVEELFQDTAKTLHRSQLLLEERVRPHSAASTSTMGPSPPPGGSESVIAAVQALEGLSRFRAFVEAARGITARLLEEAAAPSASVQKVRLRGQPLPILRRVVGGLDVRHCWQAAACREAQSLWWDGGEEGGVASHSIVSGAQVAALLVRGALCVDATHHCSVVWDGLRVWAGVTQGKASPSLLQDPQRADSLHELFRRISQALPHELCAWLFRSVTSLLSGAAPNGELGFGIFLVPGWAAYALLEGDQAVGAAVRGPLDCISSELLAVYLSNEVKYMEACGQCMVYIAAALDQLLRSGDPRRKTLAPVAVRLLLEAFLLPLERTFVADAARPGMAHAVHAVLVQPLSVISVALQCRHNIVNGTVMERVLSTAQYRLLLLVESIARSELGCVSGQAHTTAQQKRYEEMLRQAHGKMSLPLLRRIAVDKQLVLEETTMHSPDRHRVHRLHDGTGAEGGRVVFLYVDDGVVYAKMGRTKSFQAVLSVEALFKPLEQPP